MAVWRKDGQVRSNTFCVFQNTNGFSRGVMSGYGILQVSRGHFKNSRGTKGIFEIRRGTLLFFYDSVGNNAIEIYSLFACTAHSPSPSPELVMGRVTHPLVFFQNN